MQPRKPRIGLALGAGSARGWAHIGVIRALEEAGIRADFVAGTSIGALVGAAYAAGELDRLEEWVRKLRVRDVVGLMDVSLHGGLIKGERLFESARRDFADPPIEGLRTPFAATATTLHGGEEIWLRSGSALDAVRASISVPGLFPPVSRDGVLLVDGGLANPVPVSLVRAMGADVIIAVELGSGVLGRLLPTDQASPSMLDVVITSMQVMQARIARSRMAGEPPHVLVSPRLGHFGVMDYHRAGEAIEEGRRAVERVADHIASLHLNPATAPG